MLRGKPVLVTRTRPLHRLALDDEPGTILGIEGEGISVACAPGALLVLALKPEGRAEMSGADWARGAHPETGERFSSEGAVGSGRVVTTGRGRNVAGVPDRTMPAVAGPIRAPAIRSARSGCPRIRSASPRCPRTRARRRSRCCTPSTRAAPSAIDCSTALMHAV